MKLPLDGPWEALLTDIDGLDIPEDFNETMVLPGTTSQQGLGPENPAQPEGYLTDVHAFEGHLWLRRAFRLEEDAPRLMLTL